MKKKTIIDLPIKTNVNVTIWFYLFIECFDLSFVFFRL